MDMPYRFMVSVPLHVAAILGGDMSDERQQHWEQVYRDRESTSVSWYQEYPEISLQLIERSGVTTEDALIDIGGGASLLVDNLLQRNFSRVAVLDISASALECAGVRLSDRAAQVEWYVADVTTFEPPHRFTLWHDRAVFHFLTAMEDRRNYLGVLEKTLQPGGWLILATFALDGPERCSGLLVERYDVTKMCATLGDRFELVETRDEQHTTPAGGEQKFTYALFRYLP